MRLAEGSFEFAELSRRKARPVSLLFDRLARRRRRRTRRQWQRALVFVLARRRYRRRCTLVPGLCGRPRTLQHVFARCGAGYQVNRTVRHIRLRQFTVLVQSETVIVVVVVVAAAGVAVRREISLSVLVMLVVEKHFGDIRSQTIFTLNTSDSDVFLLACMTTEYVSVLYIQLNSIYLLKQKMGQIESSGT